MPFSKSTEVMYYNKTFFDAKKGKAKLLPTYNQGLGLVTEFEPYWNLDFGPNTRLDTLWKTIYGAAYDLDKDVTLYDGTEIYGKSIANRAKLPMITPQFAKYYRLTVTPKE